MSIQDDFKELDLIFPIINGKVSMAINRKLHRSFRKEGIEITPEQWTVLSFLWKEDGVSQQKLCDATFKDKPSMTRLIDNLVKQNLVARNTPASDRRTNLIYLTEEGRAIEPRANKAVSETMEFALAGLDKRDIENVRRLLKHVFENIKDSLS